MCLQIHKLLLLLFNIMTQSNFEGICKHVLRVKWLDKTPYVDKTLCKRVCQRVCVTHPVSRQPVLLCL
jgi:hypothetical protein